MRRLKLNSKTRKIIAVIFFAIGMILFFNKGYLNFDFEHPMRSLLSSFTLHIMAIIAIIFGSKEEPKENHHYDFQHHIET